MKTMLLFDIDGTLLLTGGSGKVAFDISFRELHGIQNAWGDLAPDGKTDPVIMDELALRTLGRKLSRPESKKLKERYLFHFKREMILAKRFHLLPGVKQLLKVLGREADFILGLATGNLEEAAWLKLKRGNIHSHFAFGGFGSDAKDRTKLTDVALKRGLRHAREKISAKRIFVIGDTPYDIKAGKALGLNTIAVATGSYSSKALLEHKPHHCLPHLNEPAKFFRLISK